MDYNKFFSRKAEVIARDLLGRLLVRKTDKGMTGGQIIETGAYEGGKQTPSRTGMNYAPGTIFLMPRRGYHLFNIASEREGKPSCVELREIALHDRPIAGPGKISKYLDLTPEFDKILFEDELQLLGEGSPKSRIIRSEGNADNCLGYFSIKK